MKLLIANWKAYMNKAQVMAWLEEFLDLYNKNSLESKLSQSNTCIVICPPTPLIPLVQEFTEMYTAIKIGAQTVSSIQRGAYTGEVTAELLKDYVSYALIGHSERRKHFKLTEEEIALQIQNCIDNTISPILCVRNDQDKVYDNVKIVAFEPPNAIGGGKNAKVADVLEMKKQLKLPSSTSFMYGASVDITNISSYLQTGEINGLLVGTASIKAASFYNLAVAMI